MPVPTLNGLPPWSTLEDMKTKINGITNEINNLLVSLDTLNIVELDAKVVIANTITAEKMNVNELSAIAADLGHITAGLIESIEIYGSYIATTAAGVYPKAEMSNTNNLFGSYLNANEGITIEANYAGAPSINLIHDGNIVGRINMIFGYPEYYGKGGLDLLTDNNGNINLNPGGTGGVRLNSSDFSKMQTSSGATLQAALNGKATAGVSTSLSGSANGGIAPGTVLMVSGGGTVTWTGIPNHSHAQN